MSGRAGWVVEHWVGGATMLHSRRVPVDGRRRLSLLEVTRPAVVLGSTSSRVDGDLVWRGERVEVCRRASGGGLVWLDPGNSFWVDVFVPTGDVLWERDVGRAFLWLGEAVAEAARSLGLVVRTHRGGHRRGPDGGAVCFEGVGAGEVLVGERKLVGISQRRTRHGSRFQCVWYRDWDLGAVAGVVGPVAARRASTVGVGCEELGVAPGRGGLLDAVTASVASR